MSLYLAEFVLSLTILIYLFKYTRGKFRHSESVIATIWKSVRQPNSL